MHTTQTSSLCVTGWRVYFGSLLLQLSTVNKAVWGENPALSKQVLLMEYTCEYKFWCVHCCRSRQRTCVIYTYMQYTDQ